MVNGIVFGRRELNTGGMSVLPQLMYCLSQRSTWIDSLYDCLVADSSVGHKNKCRGLLARRV
jgi:hypothetical protein